jgi:hypothetical protein
VTRAGAARWTEWALRLSLATAFLSGVADRLGAWGPHGSPHASWGDWLHFRIYADRLNWYMPAAVQPAAAVLATAGEVIFVSGCARRQLGPECFLRFSGFRWR